MYYVYILQSASLNKYYVGHTENVDLRLDQHNTKFFKNSWTAHSDDWIIFHTILCESKTQALKIERHIKNMKSRKYYFNLVQYSDIELKLKEKYKD